MSFSLFQDPAVVIAGLLLVVTLLADLLLRRVRARLEAEPVARAKAGDDLMPARRAWLAAVVPPLSLGIWFYGTYAAARILAANTLPPEWHRAERWLENLSGAGAFVAFLWLLSRCARIIDVRLNARALSTEGTLDDVLLPLIGVALRLILPVLALFFLIRLWPLDPGVVSLLRKLAAVGLIGALSWLAIRAAGLVERAVTKRSDLQAMGDFEGRALVTRVSVLRKVVIILVGLFALAAVLMMFDEVRDVGRSILASAGVAGLILGIAAQRSLGGLFAGLQIALTQPIRLGDQIKVAEEVGVVEEITLTYVVLRLWDGRRLVVPINHLIENPVVNYTRNSSAQIGAVFLRVDFTLPVPEFRAFMKSCVEQSPHWDKKIFTTLVTDARHESMEIRVTAGAATPGGAFAIQCELREKALDFIHQRYPQCLPKAREEGKPIQSWQVSEEFGARENRLENPPSQPSAPELPATR